MYNILTRKIPMSSKEKSNTFNSTEETTKLKDETYAMEQRLNSILDTVAGNHWWKNLEGRYLGCNMAVAKLLGIEPRDIIGKTDYELPWSEHADALLANDLEVIRTGRPIKDEEQLTAKSGKILTFLVSKFPMKSREGEIIGTIGTSIDITAEKEATRLKLENEAQKIQIQEQEKFRKAADQVVHDIRSPLASLIMIIKSCQSNIPESARIALKEAATAIGDIANNLLSKYKKSDVDEIQAKIETRQPLIVSLALMHILTDKKYQYKDLPIKFDSNFAADSSFTFIEAEPTSFKRMISNLINNAVDALEGKAGKVKVKLKVDTSHVKIIIQDNGKGMPKTVINKIINNIAVTDGKQSGHGIGFTQIRETLRHDNGELKIDSEVGKGTVITLTFPKAPSASWLAEEIKLNADDTVVILDDDASIHSAWETRFKNHPNIKLQHFTLAEDTINFINTSPARDKVFLLADFELLKQELNGLHVIERTVIRRSILVTSHYANQIICGLAAKTGTKILPKQLASEVSIKIEKNSKKGTSKVKKIGLVIIDDNKLFANSVAALLKQINDATIDVYYCPHDFLEHVSRYTKDTKIFIDNNLSANINGVELAKQLHEDGFKYLYILSGDDFIESKVPNYLTVILKTDTDGIAEFAKK